MPTLDGRRGNPNTRPTFRPPTRTELDFSLSVALDPVTVSSGGFGTRSDGEASLQDVSAATVDTAANLTVNELTPGAATRPGTVGWVNLTPGVCNFDAATGRLTRVADGNATILYRTPARTRRADVAVSRVGGQVATSFLSWDFGSLAKAMADGVDDRIAGKTAATAKPIWSTRDDAAASYAWNAAGWLAGVDLTCLSPWNSYEGPRMAGVLISPRHVAFAYHYNPIGLPPGQTPTIRFVTSAGATVTRSITGGVGLGTNNAAEGYRNDVAIGVLDSDVPAGVAFAKVLPSTFATSGRAKWFNKNLRVPVVKTDQDKRAHVADWMDRGAAGDVTAFAVPADAQRLAFYEDWVNLDSSSPAFAIVGGSAVLLGTATFGVAGAVPDYSGATLQTAINAAMTTLGGGYQLTTIDLSGYNSY